MYNTNKKKVLTKIPKERICYSYAKGWFIALSTLPLLRVQNLEADIRQVLGIKPQSFYRRLLGLTMPTAEEYFKINDVFKRYGITNGFYVSYDDYERDLQST